MIDISNAGSFFLENIVQIKNNIYLRAVNQGRLAARAAKAAEAAKKK